MTNEPPIDETAFTDAIQDFDFAAYGPTAGGQEWARRLLQAYLTAAAQRRTPDSLIEKLEALAEHGNSRYIDVKQAIAIVRQHYAGNTSPQGIGCNSRLPAPAKTKQNALACEVQEAQQTSPICSDSEKNTNKHALRDVMQVVREALDRGGFHATARGHIEDGLFISKALAALDALEKEAGNG